MENTVASQEFVILALGLLLSFIIAASIAFTPSKEDEKEEELKFTVTREPTRTDFNKNLKSIQKLKELDQQGLLKRGKSTTCPTYTSNRYDSFYDVSGNNYFDDSPSHSNHDCNNSYHDSSSHDSGSHDL